MNWMRKYLASRAPSIGRSRRRSGRCTGHQMTRSQSSGSRRPTTPTIGSQSARQAKRQAPWLSGKYANLRLNITFSVFKSAIGEELVDANPVASVRRPKVVRRRWRILEPAEVPVVYKAFSDDRARRVFLTLVLTGLRRFELVGLRWRHVNLVEGTLRVETSKSEEGERLIALPTTLVDALAEQFTSSPYRSDDDYVFCHPEKGRRSDGTGTRPSSRRRRSGPGSRARSGRPTTCGTRRSRTSPRPERARSP